MKRVKGKNETVSALSVTSCQLLALCVPHTHKMGSLQATLLLLSLLPLPPLDCTLFGPIFGLAACVLILIKFVIQNGTAARTRQPFGKC